MMLGRELTPWQTPLRAITEMQREMNHMFSRSFGDGEQVGNQWLAPTKTQAVREYAGRMAIEETYRDWHHHWAVRTATVPLPTEAMVARLIGIVCLAYTLQMLIGHHVSCMPAAQRRRAQWTVTGRVSWFWCGQRVFTDPGYDWSAWLTQQWGRLEQLSAPVPATCVAEPVFALAA